MFGERLEQGNESGGQGEHCCNVQFAAMLVKQMPYLARYTMLTCEAPKKRRSERERQERESTIVPQIGNFGPLVFSFDDISTMMPPAAPIRGGVLCVSDDI